MSLQAVDQYSLVFASPIWWPIPAARGEKMVRSVPRSRCSLSCAPSTDSRIWSSDTLSLAGTTGFFSFSAATCASR